MRETTLTLLLRLACSTQGSVRGLVIRFTSYLIRSDDGTAFLRLALRTGFKFTWFTPRRDDERLLSLLMRVDDISEAIFGFQHRWECAGEDAAVAYGCLIGESEAKR